MAFEETKFAGKKMSRMNKAKQPGRDLNISRRLRFDMKLPFISVELLNMFVLG